MTIGIYCIENIINNKKYIGMSSGINTYRLSSHKRRLRKNIHVNACLQNAYNKSGKIHSEETKKKMSKSHIGKVFSETHRKNLSIARNRAEGYKHD
jgi:hypothetical protein